MSEQGRVGAISEAVFGASTEIARADRAGGDAQLELLELPTRFAGEEAERQRARARGPGRPPGAQNVATARLREYLLGRGVNPLMSLAAWSQHSPETLALELGCTRLEAFRELRATWEGLAPYFMGKALPTDETGKAVPFLQMVIGGQNVAVVGGQAPWEYLKENQGVDEPAGAVSHVDVSHGTAK